MRVEIGRDQADHWFNLTLAALAGAEQERDQYKEKGRLAWIAAENRVRRWLPFVKLIPDDYPWESIDLPPYSFEVWGVEDDVETLDLISRALKDLLSGSIRAVSLSGKEVSKIEQYARKYATQTDT